VTVPVACASCALLEGCREVTEARIVNNYHCNLWQAVPLSAWEARRDISDDLGPWALKYGVINLQAVKRKRPRRKKKHV
jgi:hypothetical protein